MIYGDLNGHAVGIVMKEMVRRAIAELRRQRTIFEAKVKVNEHKTGDDFVTSADFSTMNVCFIQDQRRKSSIFIRNKEDARRSTLQF